MNNLGGMVFIVAGIALGYWVSKGRATNFLHAINFGSTPSGATPPPTPPSNASNSWLQNITQGVTGPWQGFGPGPAQPPPTSGGGFGYPDTPVNPYEGFGAIYVPGSNVAPNNSGGGW